MAEKRVEQKDEQMAALMVEQKVEQMGAWMVVSTAGLLAASKAGMMDVKMADDLAVPKVALRALPMAEKMAGGLAAWMVA